MSSQLNEWLNRLEANFTTHVDLGLSRMQQAVGALDLNTFNIPIITVAGTNGKGSVVCALETIYHTAGYRTASYSSPHLFEFNERVKLNTKSVSDSTLCEAFSAVYAVAQKFHLTYFEVVTLAALWIFMHTKLDVIILEVGLGGRLDAVNVIDPSLSIITSIDLDHIDRLGNTREAIAKEKAGIFRENTPAICGDPNPPNILQKIAQQLHAPFIQVQIGSEPLPDNGLLSQNMHTAFTAIQQLQSILPVPAEKILQGIQSCALPGRQQIIYDKCKHIFDVAHNPAGLKKLHDRIVKEHQSGRVLLVIGMLITKDLLASFSELKSCVNEWYVAPIQNEHAANLDQLTIALERLNIKQTQHFENLPKAYQAAFKAATPDDLIVVAGSFYTVAEVSRGKRMIKQAPPSVGFSATKVP